MSNEEVIKMLNADITGEIEAILTYLRHDFVVEICKISREMEEIAIDEMRHVEWLSSAVVKLGGIPTIEHAELHLEGEDLIGMLKRDVGLEEMAIKQYEDHIAAIEDPGLIHLLRKIMNEEIEHRDEFAEYLEEVSTEETKVEETEVKELPNEEPVKEKTEKSCLTVGSLINK